MGCGYSIACRDCRKSYYLGYGSYQTWLILYGGAAIKTPERFDEQFAGEPSVTIPKNKNYRKVLSIHSGHDLVPVNWDFYSTDRESGSLYMEGLMGERQVIIGDFADYEKIDMTLADF